MLPRVTACYCVLLCVTLCPLVLLLCAPWCCYSVSLGVTLCHLVLLCAIWCYYPPACSRAGGYLQQLEEGHPRGLRDAREGGAVVGWRPEQPRGVEEQVEEVVVHVRGQARVRRKQRRQRLHEGAKRLARGGRLGGGSSGAGDGGRGGQDDGGGARGGAGEVAEALERVGEVGGGEGAVAGLVGAEVVRQQGAEERVQRVAVQLAELLQYTG
eukprot:940275-Prorocentrum_minimum.AAC.2